MPDSEGVTDEIERFRLLRVDYYRRHFCSGGVLSRPNPTRCKGLSDHDEQIRDHPGQFRADYKHSLHRSKYEISTRSPCVVHRCFVRNDVFGLVEWKCMCYGRASLSPGVVILLVDFVRVIVVSVMSCRYL